MRIFIDYNENYQLYYLKQAINEVHEIFPGELVLRTDHYNGCNYINGVKYPIIFPLYLKNYTSELNRTKSVDYNFIGTIIDKRSWVYKYKTLKSVIKESSKGRDPEQKYNIDPEYYITLSKSKFTLSPTGDCPWSYRFFEAIMCMSIPIVEKNSNDIYKKDYFYYYVNDEHIYREDMAIKNYNTFISRHFLSK